jgi:hypothetical protein
MREGYKLPSHVVRNWVGRSEWGKVKRAREEGFEWDEEMWGQLEEEGEDEGWVEEI